MIRYRALFEDLTGLREGHGQPKGDRVAGIRDRAADNRDRAALDSDLAGENANRTADTPR